MKKIFFSAALLLLTTVHSANAQYIGNVMVTNVTDNSATLSFDYNTNGEYAYVAGWVSQQSLSWYPDSTHEWTLNYTSTGTQTMSMTIYNLQPQTAYYYNMGIYGTNGSGTAFAEFSEPTFTTTGGGGTNTGSFSAWMNSNYVVTESHIEVTFSATAPGSSIDFTLLTSMNDQNNVIDFQSFTLSSGNMQTAIIPISGCGQYIVTGFGNDELGNTGNSDTLYISVWPTDVKEITFTPEKHTVTAYDILGRTVCSYPYATRYPSQLEKGVTYTLKITDKTGRVLKTDKIGIQ